MMLGPEGYINRIKDCSYEELIEERKKIISSLDEYEKLVFSEDRSDPAWDYHPNPAVKYQVSLEYLSELCKFMKEKFNNEIVWGEDEEEE